MVTQLLLLHVSVSWGGGGGCCRLYVWMLRMSFLEKQKNVEVVKASGVTRPLIKKTGKGKWYSWGIFINRQNRTITLMQENNRKERQRMQRKMYMESINILMAFSIRNIDFIKISNKDDWIATDPALETTEEAEAASYNKKTKEYRLWLCPSCYFLSSIFL